MSCLDNLIGLLGSQEYAETRSGLYINDLPGMTLAQLNKIKDETEDYEDPDNAWEAILTRAKSLFKADIRNKAKKYYRSRILVDDEVTGRVENNTVLTSESKYKGIYFDFWSYSRNIELHLNYARMYLSVAAQPTIYIFNAATGDQIASYQAGSEAQEVKIDLFHDLPVYQYNKIFVAYDDASLNAYKVKATDYTDSIAYYNRGVSTTSTVIDDNLSGEDIGLALSYQVRCSIENYICQNIDLLVESFWYKCGVEWMNERMFSDRVNRYTLIDIDKAKELRTYYQDEYTKMLDDVMNGIQIPDDGLCFECAREFNKRKLLP